MEYFIVAAWFAVAIIALIVEIQTVELVSIWFVVGAFAAMIVSACVPTNYAAQLITFIVVSVIALIALRPVFSKKVNMKNTDVDVINTMSGYKGFAETDIDSEGGKVNVNGTSWQAVSESPIQKGKKIIVIREDNLTLVVREESKEK